MLLVELTVFLAVILAHLRQLLCCMLLPFEVERGAATVRIDDLCRLLYRVVEIHGLAQIVKTYLFAIPVMGAFCAY